MKVTYLVNRYPATSHTFITREIQALESAGIGVQRVSIRDGEVLSTDQQGLAEKAQTTVILRLRIFALVMSFLQAAVLHPRNMLRAVFATFQLTRNARSGPIRHAAYLIEAAALARLIQRNRSEHLHAHFGTNSASIALLCHLICGVPYSLTIHGPEEFDRPEKLSLGLKIRYAQFVVAVSQFGRSQLMRWSRIQDVSKIHVIRCGVDSKFLQAEETTAPDNHELLFVGRLCEQKGTSVLIDAAARLRERNIDFRLTMIGDGDRRRTLEDQIRRLGLEEHVVLAGALPNKEVHARLQASRALVLPSFAEGLPVVLMEALALCRPVITTYIAGIPELVVDAHSGWLVPASSAVALADAMAEALTATPSRLRELGSAGRQAVQRLHDAEQEGQRLGELIQQHASA